MRLASPILLALVGFLGSCDRSDAPGEASEQSSENEPADCSNEPDSDGDGVADDCDPCPNDNPDDSDADGVCDEDDDCPGFDEADETDAEGVADGCDP